MPVRALTRGRYLSDSSRPARFYCHDRDKPRPSWLPPDKFCCRRDHYLQGKYGITCDQWWQQYEHQRGRCGICGQPFKGRIAVDHDHDTGDIDSLSDFGCNRGLRQQHRRYAKNPPGLGFKVAPAKLRAIQAADAAKRKRDRSRPAPTQPSTNGFHERTQAALKATQQGR